MTITADITNGKQYISDGVTVVYTVPWRVDDASEIRVVRTVSGNETTVPVTVSDLHKPTATVTLTAPLANGTVFTIAPEGNVTQPFAFKGQGPLDPGRIEAAFDWVVKLISRTMKAPASSPLSPLVWSADGTRIENGSITLTGDMLLRGNLADTAAGKGAELVGFKQSGAGAVGRTMQDKARERVSVLDFIPVSEHAAIRNYTSTYDCTNGIQAAIDYAIYLGGGGEVFVPSGLYKTTNTIHLGYGVTYGGTAFKSVRLTGEHSGYRGEASMRGATIAPTFSDRPCIAVQGGRRVHIARIGLKGVNASHIQAGDFGGLSASVDDTALSTWVSGSLHANANSRYAPYAGIAVDPYSGTAPTPAYPNVTFPAFLGSPSQYGKVFTDTVTVEDCYISGFVVGAVVQPCDADGNGDFVSFPGTTFEFCAYGVSVGNSQSRQVNLAGVDFRNVHTCLTNNKHGKQRGKFGGNASGATFDRTIQAFDFDLGYTGPILFSGCYGELVWRIGNFNAVPTRSSPIRFDGCEFRLVDHPSVRGVSALLFAGVANAPVVISGGQLTLPSMTSLGANVVFDGLFIDTLDTTNTTSSTGRQLAQHATGGTLPLGAGINSNKSIRQKYAALPGVPRIADLSAVLAGRTLPLNRLNRFAEWAETASSVFAGQCPHAQVVAVGKSSVTASLSGISGTLDFSSLSANFPFGVRPGDVIQDDLTGTIFLVTANAGLVATVSALNNYNNTGGGNAFRDAVNTSSGSWYVCNSRIYGGSYPILGDITSGSAVISNVQRGDGYGAFTATSLAVGDFIWQHPWLGRYFADGVTISAIDTTAKTITMSGNANATATKVPFHYWVRA